MNIIKVLVFSLVFIVLPEFVQTQPDALKYINEFNSGYIKKFECDGKGKCLGLKFSINYPHSWVQSEGRRPHVVIVISEPEKNIMFLILVMDMIEEPSKDEINEMFSEDFAREAANLLNGEYIQSKRTKIDNNEAFCFDYYFQGERLGFIIKGRTRDYSIIRKTKYVKIQFSIMQNPFKPPIDLDKTFKAYEPLFNLIINSFRFKE